MSGTHRDRLVKSTDPRGCPDTPPPNPWAPYYSPPLAQTHLQMKEDLAQPAANPPPKNQRGNLQTLPRSTVDFLWF